MPDSIPALASQPPGTSTLADRAVLAGKGALMGAADMVPGVSGGTVALITGIYTELVDAIRSLHLAWLPPLVLWALTGFRHADRAAAFRRSWATMQIGFLLNLTIGIAAAVAAAGLILPTLQERYPTELRGLFFGLVAASIIIPWRMIGRRSALTITLFLTAAALTLALLGASANPITATEQVVIGDSQLHGPELNLGDLVKLEQSTLLPAELWRTLDPATRDTILAAPANKRLTLPDLDAVTTDARGHAPSPYAELRLPHGVVLPVQTPALWFVFACGAIAICAMILPGISGAFILLMFGMYFVMASTLKGFLQLIAAGVFSPGHTIVVVLFVAGAAIGLVAFSRPLSWLLHHAAGSTMAVLAGLMLGSLRVLWPFKAADSGANVLPALDGTVFAPVALALGGAAVVLTLEAITRKRRDAKPAPAMR